MIWRKPPRCEQMLPVSSGLIHRINLLSQPTGKRVETQREKVRKPYKSEFYEAGTKDPGKGFPTF